MSWKSTSFTERTWSPSWSPALWASESGTTCQRTHKSKLWQAKKYFAHTYRSAFRHLGYEDSQLWSLATTDVEAQLCSWRLLQHDGTRQELSELVVVVRVMDSLKNKKKRQNVIARVVPVGGQKFIHAADQQMLHTYTVWVYLFIPEYLEKAD